MGIGDELAVRDLAEVMALHLGQRERGPRCGPFGRLTLRSFAGFTFPTFPTFLFFARLAFALKTLLFCRVEFVLCRSICRRAEVAPTASTTRDERHQGRSARCDDQR